MRQAPANDLRSPAVMAIAGLNVLVWLLATLTGSTDIVTAEGAFWPARVSGALGSVVPADFAQYAWTVPVWLTPVTSAFLHSGLFHLGANMVMLVFIGRFIEMALGRWLFLLLYAIGIYMGAAGQYLSDPASVIPMVGASGAISALFGAYAILFARTRVGSVGPLSGEVVRVLWLGAAWIAINLMTQLAFNDTGGGVAIFAHIGGFIAGLLLAHPLARWRFGPPRRPMR